MGAFEQTNPQGPRAGRTSLTPEPLDSHTTHLLLLCRFDWSASFTGAGIPLSQLTQSALYGTTEPSAFGSAHGGILTGLTRGTSMRERRTSSSSFLTEAAGGLRLGGPPSVAASICGPR